jgi:hypothetical protein
MRCGHDLKSLRWAIRALKKELVNFRFDYHLELVAGADRKDSLSYYIYSDRLSWSRMRLDAQGIPLYCDRLFGETYHPAYIAWYGLVNLGHHVRGTKQAGLATFLRQLEWLERRAVWRPDGVIWPATNDWWEGRVVLKAPWVSAYIQGLVISALVRGHRLTGRSALIDLALAGAEVFRRNVQDGGVRHLYCGNVLFAEYPSYPAPGALDALITALLGLYDLFVESGDSDVWRLFAQGFNGLKCALPSWDYRRRWSWYANHEYLSPPEYHKLNRVLLTTMAGLSGESSLNEYAQAWDPAHLATLGRAEVFFMFILSKNCSRLRYGTMFRNRTLLERNVCSSPEFVPDPVFMQSRRASVRGRPCGPSVADLGCPPFLRQE